MPASADRINRIAFVNPQGRIVSIAPDGGERRVLSPVDFTFQFPTWSAAGPYLAAVGSGRGGAGVFVMADRPDAPQPEQLYYSTTHIPFYLYWSPASQDSDSRRLTFIAGQPQGGIGLYLASSAGRSYELLLTGQPLFWAWSPDGGRILIHCDVNRPEARLAFFDLERRELGQNLAQPGLFQAPGVAASGRFYAIAEVDAFDNGQLVVEEILTGEQITTPYEGAIALNWSPTRDQLAFISPLTAVQRAYGPLQMLDVASKSMQRLVEATVLAFFWAPDGQKIAYLTLAGSSRLRSSRAPAPDGRSNGVYRPDPSPAQGQARSAPVETLRLELWLIDLDHKQPRQLAAFEPDATFINQFLPFFDQYGLSHRLWSPASEALVLPLLENGVPQVTIIPIDGRRPSSIAEGSMAFWSWQ